MQKNDLIVELLKNSKDYLSGSEIASIIGVTRAAVWKRVNSLRKRGYLIEGSTTKGYKLISQPDLSIESIRNILSKESCTIGLELLFYNTIGSTNSVGADLALKGCKEGTVIIADEQTTGKGRLGRRWISPAGKNLYLSIILRPPISPRGATILTIMSAVACCNAIRNITFLPVMIKWPNDLIIDDKKIGGILTEIKADIDKISYAIIGIGINVNIDIEEFPEDVREIATSIKTLTGRQFSRTDMIISILKEMQKWYDVLLSNGKMEILSHWQKLSSTIGKKVKATIWDNVYIGLAETIDNDGLLILRLQDNTCMKIDAGDITMLRDEGS